jgi:hypothetical protein
MTGQSIIGGGVVAGMTVVGGGGDVGAPEQPIANTRLTSARRLTRMVLTADREAAQCRLASPASRA